MNLHWIAVLLLALNLGAISAHAKGACKEKRKAMHTARVALKECNKAWVDSLRGDAADPGDDCGGKQSAFVTAVKDIKTCMKEEKAKK